MPSRYLPAKRGLFTIATRPLKLQRSQTRAYPHLRDHAIEEVKANVDGAFDSAIPA